MTKYIKCGGGGLPPQVLSDMEAVLNKKFGTSTTYPSNTWPDLIRTMMPLPEKSASGSIAHFEDGADEVPLKSSKFYITPTQASGTPTPSNPLPISGHTGLTVTRTGANFFEDSLYSSFKQLDGSFEGLGSDFNSLYYYIPNELVGVEITFSAYIKIPTGSTITNPRVSARVNGTNTNGNAVTSNDYTLSSVTFTPTSTSDRVRITYGSNGSQPVQFKEPQLEVGAVVTQFVEYSAPTTYPVSWSEHGTVYGGYFKDGELWKTYGHIDLGSITYTLNGGRFLCSTAFQDAPAKNSTLTTVPNANCSIFRPVVWGQVGASGNDYTFGIVTNQLLIADSDYSDTTAFKTAMNGTILTYELATPVKVADIDPLEIVSMLGVNNIWCDTGDCEVEYRADIELSLNE